MKSWFDRMKEAQEPLEEWKNIPGHLGYQISNKKRVRFIGYLKPYKDNIVLTTNGKRKHYSLETLLKMAFNKE